MIQSIAAALQTRLASLGCERLPHFVARALRAHVEIAVSRSISRIVEREVTSARIAKIFAKGDPRRPARSTGGFEGDATGGPFDQAGLLTLPPQFETNPVTGAAARTILLLP